MAKYCKDRYGNMYYVPTEYQDYFYECNMNWGKMPAADHEAFMKDEFGDEEEDV